MPLYEFECKECDETFEQLVRNTSASQAVTCPTCGSPKVEKKISVCAARVSGGESFSGASAATCAPGGT
jgi:putative FmdB family regulatory protein